MEMAKVGVKLYEILNGKFFDPGGCAVYYLSLQELDSWDRGFDPSDDMCVRLLYLLCVA
jgi:hypothetical protein